MEGGWKKKPNPTIRQQQAAGTKNNAIAEGPASLQSYITRSRSPARVEAYMYIATKSMKAAQDKNNIVCVTRSIRCQARETYIISTIQNNK